MKRFVVLFAAAAVLLGVPGAASAHGSGAYVATARGIEPPLAGVHVRITHAVIALTNRGRTPVIVLGPTGAGIVQPRRTVSWHDPRIAVDDELPPLVVRKEPGKSHHLRSWRVPLLVGGRSYAIVGSLDYRVSDGGLAELLLPFAPMPLLVLFAVGIVRRARG
ncbi:MAG: hypothetical protein HOQ28_16420 [Thermoleophilia bacterium]|nr:hypothetical protein [Thermoleophilia bacterium]